MPLSFVSNRDMLLQRIERLRRLETDSPALNRWGSKFVAVAILLLAGVVASGLRGGTTDSAVRGNSRIRQDARESDGAGTARGSIRPESENDAAAWPGSRAPG
jgi:hypothetical protein